MSDAPQTFATHRRMVPGFHYVLFLILLAVLIGSIVNLVGASGSGGDVYSPSLIALLTVSILVLGFYARSFALKAQDRVIRAEENLRCFARTGKLLDDRLTIRQIIGLRFASDEELDALAARAVEEGLSEKDIKQAIKNWRGDYYRV